MFFFLGFERFVGSHIKTPLRLNRMIPKVVHRTTRSFEKLQETSMSNHAEIWESLGFEVRNYTDQDCDRYVQNCLRGGDYEAYCDLIPRVLRTDIWRLCVLYAEGGVYTDIHIKPMMKLNSLFENRIEHVFVIDIDDHNKRVYNALIMARKESPLIMAILQRTLAHVRERIYTHHVLDITGPGVVGYVLRMLLDQSGGLKEQLYPYEDGFVLCMKHVFLSKDKEFVSPQPGSEEYIIYQNTIVFKSRYADYRNDMSSMGCDSRYENYFHRRILYKSDLASVVSFVNGKALEPIRITHRRWELEKTMNEEYD